MEVEKTSRSADAAEGYIPGYRLLDGVYRSVEVNMTQTDRVLMYMRDFGSISPVEAMRDLGCMRLAARISDLKKKGYVIQRDMVSSSNRYGDEVRYAMYRLVETRL